MSTRVFGEDKSREWVEYVGMPGGNYVEWALFRRRPSVRIFAAVGLSNLGAALLVLTQSAKLSLSWGGAYPYSCGPTRRYGVFNSVRC